MEPPYVEMNGPAIFAFGLERIQLALADTGKLPPAETPAQALVIAGPHRVGDVFTESDFYGAYGLGARALQHGHIDPARYAVVGPLYEAALALVGLPVRDLFLAAELLSLGSLVATLLLWFAIVRARAGALPALLALALLAANGQFFRYGYSVTTDALALALQAGALALLLARPVTGRRARAAGAVAALAFLTRYNAAVLLPAGLVALLAGWTDGPPAARRAMAVRFAAGFALPVLPWVLFSLASGAHFSFQLHHNIAYEVFAHARGITWDDYQARLQSQFPTPWSVLARDPAAVIGRIAFNVVDHVRLDVLKLVGWPLALAAVAGAWLGLRDGSLGRLRAAWLAAALLFLALVPAFHSERYSLAVLPAWTALAGLAFGSPRMALVLAAGGKRRVWLKPALALLVLAVSLRAAVTYQRRTLGVLPVEVRTLARAALPLVRPGERVYARKPHFAWYAGMTATAFPFADSLAELAADARRDGVRWLYFSWLEAELRPQFLWLLDTTAAVPGLTVRAVTGRNPAVLYEIGPGFGAPPAWRGDPWQTALHGARARVLIDATDWRARLVVALDEQHHGRWEQALPLLEEALPLAPDNLDVLLALGDEYAHLGRAGEARAVFERVEQLDPGNPRARVGEGWVALLEGRIPDAAERWRPAVPFVEDAGTLKRMLELFGHLHDDAGAAAVRARQHALGLTP